MRVLKFLGLLLAGFLAGIVLFWFWLAVGIQLSGAARLAGQALVVVTGIGALGLLLRGRGGWLATLGVAGIVLAQVWWSVVPARNDRDWSPEYAHIVSGEMADGQLVLHNVRNFAWATPDSATESWETRVVDPDAITSLDMISSVWGNPLIAHTMLSFGFADGQHVVFSAETRREVGEVYSTFGGFVREFELMLLAADERDVIHLRTDIRGEEVSLFPLDIPPEERRELFLGFVAWGNELNAQPEWYNTVLMNCTTMPFRLARMLGDRIPLDWRVVASGRLHAFLHDRGILRPDLSLAEIERRALLPRFGPVPEDGVAYSRQIRASWQD